MSESSYGSQAYNGTYTWNQPLVSPWFIPGWTNINANEPQYEIPANEGNPLNPFFPTNLSFVNITGNFFDPNSSGIGGFFTLMMSTGITVDDNGAYFRMPPRLTGVMQNRLAFSYNNWGNGILYMINGHLDIEVFATDQTVGGETIVTDNGQPLFYFVTEHFMGGRTYHIEVPSSSSPGPVDIESLIVAGTIQEYNFDPVFPMGDMWTPDEAPGSVGRYTGV